MVQTRIIARLHHDITATSIAATVAGATTFYYQYSKTDLEASPLSATTEPPSTSTPESVSTSTSNLPSQREGHVGIFETDFADKLSSKPYLNYHNSYARNSIIASSVKSTKRLWGRVARGDISPVANYTNDGRGGYEDINSVGGGLGDSGSLTLGLGERPKGVPRKIRILSIDVPELREVFDGECRVNLTSIYPDDIAPPKVIKIPAGYQGDIKNQHKTEASNGEQESPNISNKSGTGDAKDVEPQPENTNAIESKKMKKRKEETEKILVLQKSLARSLVRCRNAQSKHVGVEILEASVYDLNPHNMRRAYRLGSYRYDPGKHGYGRNKNVGGDDMLQRRMSVGAVSEDSSSATKNRNRRVGQMTLKKEGKDTTTDDGDGEKGIREGNEIASDDDEMNAPWNQYAWIEEMQLRIHGHIPFDANVERSSFLSRLIFGNCYCRTVKSSRSFVRWFIPSFLSGDRVGGVDGIDGDFGINKRVVNRASSKPHAVIADGAAMQRVPGALRYLTKCCAEADIPLFIINDPRVWGGNTHSDLASAAKDMRKTLKARIVSNALTIKEGKMFERGRLLGKMETETKWQMKDVGRRTRDALQDASARMKKERDEDWSKLSSEELMQQLIDKKVITVANEKKRTGEDARLDAELTSTFAEICCRYATNTPNKKIEETKSDGAKSKNCDKVDANNNSGEGNTNTDIPV